MSSGTAARARPPLLEPLERRLLLSAANDAAGVGGLHLLEELDYGDAPDSVASPRYPTLAAHNGARHVAVGPWLGTEDDFPDVEPDGQPHPAAFGDDFDSDPRNGGHNHDDENGVAIPLLFQGAATFMDVNVSGGGGWVTAWFDFDADGQWQHPGELVFEGWLPDGGHPIPVPVPIRAALGVTFARFRISSQEGLTPEGPAPDGEVEDHEVVIQQPPEMDYGDAPDSLEAAGYPTLAAHNGARHIPTGPWLGQERDYPDAEPDGQPHLAGLGDNWDTDPANGGLNHDDENGVVIPLLVQGVPTVLDVYVDGGGGVVQAWVDFNRDMTWQHPGELVYQSWLPDGGHPVHVVTPVDAVIGQTFARFRISADGGLGPGGFAPDGEVEDYEVIVAPQPEMDWGDAPDSAAVPGYPTLSVHNGARHLIGGPYLGLPDDTPDPELEGQPDAAAAGDNGDTDPANPGPNWNDENGVAIPPLTQGISDVIEVEVGGGGGKVVAWIDFDGDGDWQTDEKIHDGWLADGLHPIPVTVPLTAAAGTTFARFRISYQDVLGPTGWAPEGEVEDYEVQIDELIADWGDAPDSYQTLWLSGGPAHVIGGPYFGLPGQLPDADADGQPHATAQGDDWDAGGNDELGVEPTGLHANVYETLNVHVGGGGGIFQAWIDFNADGVFDPQFEVAYDGPVSDGYHELPFQVPAGAEIGTTFARFRISTTGGLGPGGLAPDGEVEDREVYINVADWGDAPAPYPTLGGANGASHGMDQHLFLGNQIDIERDGLPHPDAAGDDEDALDDEDGVVWTTPLVPGQPAEVEVTAHVSTSHTSAHLHAWIDFDGDGSWSPAEKIIDAAGVLNIGTYSYTFNVPAGAAVGRTFARFRLANAIILAPDGHGGAGEVEDHLAVIEADWGDAPDSEDAPGYPTLSVHDGARHVIGGPYFGLPDDQPDPEPDGQPEPSAEGDNNDTDPFNAAPNVDDENGATIPALRRATTETIELRVGGGGGVVAVWIDFNQDQTWALSERVYHDWLPDGLHPIAVSVPPNAALGETFARFRISTQRDLLPTGLAPDGEVEDHAVWIDPAPPMDYGDAPDSYKTLALSNGARHVIAGPYLGLPGAVPDADPDGQPSAYGYGDDQDAEGDDENGVWVGGMPVSIEERLSVDVGGGGGVFQAWIDFNGNGAFDHPSEEVYNGPLTDGQHSLPFLVPANAVPGYSFARFRISTAGNLRPEGFAADGEVEDRHAYISRSDWGDAPDTYPTLAADNGASHDHPHILLGSAADTEPDGLPHPRALGDDSDGIDDEDGVTFITPVVPGSPAQVSVTATVPLTPHSGYLNAWVDFDRSGTWEADEQVFDGWTIPHGTSVLSFDVPPGAEPGQTFARFRLSFGHTNLEPSGRCPVGEVEDYEVEIAPPPMDYGDAPDSYGTLARSDGARHVIGGPYLGQRGDVPDADPDGQPTADALGDDFDADGPDESGVSWPYLYPGVQQEVVVDVGGGGGVFQAWVDFNNNGRFDLPEEEVFNEWLPEGRHQLGLTTPTSAEQHFAITRCRISTSGGLAPGGLALDGEVEDYRAMVRYLDWGDAPETYPTLAADGGASHEADHDFCLGNRLDQESDGSPESRALGDDSDNTDDEDGVTFLSQVVAGDSAAVMVEVRIQDSPGPGVLDGWIDFDRSGTWEADEQILDSVEVYNGLAVYPFIVPPEAEPGQSFSRFRLSTIVGLGPGGFGDTGEVEDHEVIILPPPLDFGDAPDSAAAPGYPTLEAHNGARHIPGGPWLGASRDYPDEEPDGQPDPAAMGDNLDTDPANGGLNANDENGISGGPLIQAVPVTIDVTVNGGGGIVQAWVDFDGDSVWQHPGELVFEGHLPDGTHPITVTAPANAVVAPTFARLRISTAGGLTPVGFAADGEVEDHQIIIDPQPPMDWGDARDSAAGGGYPTLWVSNGARHTIGGPFFGEPGDAPDDEPDGQPDAAALGDNADTDPANPGPNRDDENGVTIPTLRQGASEVVEVEVGGGGGRVMAWIDFDGDRTWQSNETIFDGLLGDGLHQINVNVPIGAIVGKTAARFRISHQDTLGPTGWAPEGEVEDHEVWIADAAPQVEGVFVKGSAWSTDFLNHLQTTGQGNSGLGYWIPVGSPAQLDTLPWVNLDQVTLVFSEPVNVSITDLHVYGLGVPSYSFATHGYILPNMAVWTFPTPIGADKLLLDLSDSVTNAAGAALDGEWVDAVSSYPSGDGSAGGDFRFRLNVLPGDVDQSGEVRSSDTIKVRRKSNTAPGDPDYSCYYDVDGSGEIRSSDTIKVRRKSNTELPDGEPTVPPGGPAAGWGGSGEYELIAAALASADREAADDQPTSSALDALCLPEILPLVL